MYSAEVFNVRDIHAAKRIILTDEVGLTSAERWERETPYLMTLIDRLNLKPDSVVLDYGCGVGRLSKALIDRYGCRVVGADISRSMRAFATASVKSDRFFACAPDMIDTLGMKFDAALAVWVLQHCAEPVVDIDRIDESLQPGERLFIVNEKVRCIPTIEGWRNDGVDIRGLLGERYRVEAEGAMDPDIVTRDVSERTFWAVYAKGA